ncbi:Hypothetical protein CFV354_1619 [Campylobacter fetus subsp. venerealis NCTC 10354]|nr:Hypothetical protein CFV354_1619 [Campylobacter fetus subsp. venerealis NCTC 10354]
MFMCIFIFITALATLASTFVATSLGIAKDAKTPKMIITITISIIVKAFFMYFPYFVCLKYFAVYERYFVFVCAVCFIIVVA